MVGLWPHTKINNKELSFSPSIIEELFNEIYNPYQVVYVSRGRVAISLIQQIEGIQRKQLTFIQPYSSHCVISAVGEFSAPSTIHPDSCDFHIVYHQFGHKNIVDKKLYNNVLIEDSVDSIILSNEENELFPNNGKYAIVSLSKIMNLPFGSIVICKYQEDAKKLIEHRNSYDSSCDFRGFKNIIENHYFLDAILRNYPGLTPINNLDKLKMLFVNSKTKIKNNLDFLSCLLDRPEISSKSFNKRLPANLFFEDLSEKIVSDLKALINIEVPKRNYYDYNKCKTKLVNLIPVHEEVIFNGGK